MDGVDGFFIHPVSDERVMAGNGTIGLELVEDLDRFDAVLVPWGGGGLTTGIAADERTMLLAFLESHRDTLRLKTRDLDAAGLATTLPPSTLTLGGLLKHLAAAARVPCMVKMQRAPQHEHVPASRFQNAV